MFLLKEIRMENGMTRAELARALGLNQGTLANYENETREASYEMLKKFAEFFDISVDELLGVQPTEYAHRLNGPLNVTEKQLITTYRALDEDRKKLIREFMRLLHESAKYAAP